MESVPYPDAIGGASQPHGWDSVDDNGRFAKNGRMGFGTAQIYRFPDGISVAVVANTYVSSNLGGTAQGVYSRAASAINSDLVPPGYDLFAAPKSIMISP